MASRWTEQQERAIALHGRNLLVAAAAGSGKTAVLVERIVRMITEEPVVDVDCLLVLTFTRAAAMEMKERIATRIDRLLAEDPENTNLQRQAVLLNHASITTIDSFCLKIVKDYFSELDLDPDFRVGEEGELTLLQADCMEQLLESCYEKGDPDFLEFAEAYGGAKGDGHLEDYISRVYRFAQSCPYPEDWLEEASRGFLVQTREELDREPFMVFLMEYYRKLLLDLKEAATDLLEICLEEDGPYAYEEMMRSDLIQIDRLLAAENLEELCSRAGSVQFIRKTTKRQKEASAQKKARVSGGRDEIKKQLKKILTELDSFEEESFLPVIQGIRRPMLCLLRLAADFGTCYRTAKAEKNILDFNDLEHFALSILVKKGEGRTAAAKELRRQFTEILIDEYQDSNYLQDLLLESISGKEDDAPNMFMVGDVKQSIYRFRMARPEIFVDKYEQYTREDSLYQKIDLQKNFRSRPEILEGVNRIFRRIMIKDLGGICYDEDAALYPGNEYPAWTLETMDKEEKKGEDPASPDIRGYISGGDHKALRLVLVDMDQKKSEIYLRENQVEGALDATAAEAHAAAGQIRRIMQEEQWVLDKETGTYHRASYRDMVILLRSLSGRVETYLDVLTAEGIPACAPATGYFDALEVRIMLSFLQIIDNPLQDIPLAAVLKSPAAPSGSFQAGELAEISALYKNAGRTAQPDFYSAMEYYQKQKPESGLAKKIGVFLKKMYSYREKSEELPVYELIRFLYRDTGYYDYVTAMPAGVVRRMNLDMLVEKAMTYENTSYHGLFHFVRYMEHLKKYEVDFEQGQPFGEQDDIVRIYSIHKSKGLEYPIVLLGGLGKRFNQLDSRLPILLHPELGIAADYIDVEKRCRTLSVPARAIAQRLKMDSLGEELRILYVAMTRARESLIMIAADPWVKKHREQYETRENNGSPLSLFQICSAGSYLDWIFMACADRMDEWMEVEVETAGEVFIRPSIQQAGSLQQVDQLRQLALQWGPGSRAGERIAESADQVDGTFYKKLQTMGEHQYDFEEETGIQSKFSVSELKRLAAGGLEYVLQEEMEELPVLETLPSFMAEEHSFERGSDRGTAYHRALERIPLDRTWHTDIIAQELSALADAGKMRREAVSKISAWDIYTLYHSSLGQRMIAADKRGQLYRERQFVLSLPACQLSKQWKSQEPVLLQGVIDAWFEEEGELILVDYKTDRGVTEEELIKRYERQFALYRISLEQITGKKVKESYLWSFSWRKAISMDFIEDAEVGSGI